MSIFLKKQYRFILMACVISICSSSVVLADTAKGKRFGKDTPFQVADLPINSKLRKSLDKLKPSEQQKSLKHLNKTAIPESDLDHMKANIQGAVYYVEKAAGPAAVSIQTSNAQSANALPAIDVFKLHSRPGSSRVVYLDFDGHIITNTGWNSDPGSQLTYNAVPYDLDSVPASFNTEERNRIFEIWHRIAEDYSPFDIDVTTQQPAAFGPTIGRILFTKDTDANGNPMPEQGAGGVAYLNVFNDVFGAGSYVNLSPALVYYNNLSSGSAAYMAEAGSHEFGHNLGLTHHGVNAASANPNCALVIEYYCGMGNSLISWAPIMGESYFANVTQWSKGEYPSANNPQDDLSIIAGNLPYRTDDHSNTTAGATVLTVGLNGIVESTTPQTDPGNTVPANKGIIGSSSDIDVFALNAIAGSFKITITPAWAAFTHTGVGGDYRGANLDVQAKLIDSTGKVISTDTSVLDTKATMYKTLNTGRYYLAIQGQGNILTPYSNYNSMGEYFITVEQSSILNNKADFNKDGKSDIIWRNKTSGSNYQYQMNGAAVTAKFIDTVADPNWKIQGLGDYNGDNNADILWRNTSTGVNYVYLMNDSSISALYVNTVNPVWKVAGNGDFNGDGKSDILWRNSSTGDNYIYQMDGAIPTSVYLNQVSDQAWQVKGTGDYNGDGTSDILWQNNAGVNFIYFMNDNTVQSSSLITSFTDLDWIIQGSGDFNADGKADILWRNITSGDNNLFLMNGSSVNNVNINNVPAAPAGTGWEIKGIGDYDGDSKADILWRNAQSGTNYLYKMNGQAITSSSLINTVGDTSWEIVNLP